MSYREIIWACDPIGSGLFISGTTLSLMALDWTGGAFPWSDAHVVGPLTLGLLLLVAFGLYGECQSDLRSTHLGFELTLILY